MNRCRRPTRALRCLGLAVVIMGAIPSPAALAQARPDSRTMTCSAVKALIKARGAVVVGTGPYIYDRYVSNGSFCAPTQIADNGFLASADNPNCLAGYVCRENTLQPFE